jgi:hypothetical protein
MSGTENDPMASIGSIQTALFRQYEAQKFLVVCAAADANKQMVHFSSSGDGYCSVLNDQGMWCQAVALIA